MIRGRGGSIYIMRFVVIDRHSGTQLLWPREEISSRFYFKQQKWELAEVEIKNAQELWDNVNKSHISCLKCNTVLEVSIKQLYGDLNLEMNTTKGFRKARSYYNDAEAMLKLDMWKNKFSCPKKVIGENVLR
ncbi:hypothetical protein Tco_0775308 [Tanacetum coccineum]